ncbi:MAG: DUF892 family protein [Chitinophagaceae bacterium]|nr:DUF892 family protein [Chitinophagaceae bacterium]
MSANNQSINTLHNLLDHDARKFTCGEIELKGKLHQWISDAGSMQLKMVLQKYIDIVQQHVDKFESFFEAEDISSLSFSNPVMEAFIKDAGTKLALCTDAAIKDACLLATIQCINHFKIAAYGTAAAFALELGMEKHAAIFHEAEVNEKQVDDRLSQLATYEINRKAKTHFTLHE